MPAMFDFGFLSEIEHPKSQIEMEASCISYKETGFFSPTVIDYIENRAELQPFYGYRPDMDGFAELLKNKKVVADREILYRVLSKQYAEKSESPTAGKSES